MFANGVGANVSDIQALCTAQPITVDVGKIVYSLIDDTSRKSHLSPSYLDDEQEHHDYGWWDWYGFTDQTDEGHCNRPHTMKIIDTDMFVRPKSVNDVFIKGRYFQKPATVALPSDILPFNSLFDEVFREGVVRIVATGIAMPMTDPAFNMFVTDEVDSVLDSRGYMAPARRMRRSDYI
jgi:hypothetical protein